MDSTSDSKSSLPSQRSRNLRDRHTGVIVPDSRASSSSDGPANICDARVLLKDVIAEITSRGQDDAEGSSFRKPGPASIKGKRRSNSGSRASSPGGRSPSSRSRKTGEEEVFTVSSGDDGDGEKTDVDNEDGESFTSEGGTKRKRGRPPSTGDYVGLADAVQRYNAEKERELRLEQERELMALTSERLFEKAGLNVEEAIEDLKWNPTPDLANRVRGLQKKVLHVAKASKNLTGCFVKELKQAALFTTACVEVLRTRMDSDSASEAHREVEGIKRQLEEVKRERGEAIKRIEELERRNRVLQEKKEASTSRGTRAGGWKRIMASHDSSTSSEEGNKRKKQRRKSHSKSPKEKGTIVSEAIEISERVETETAEFSNIMDTASPEKRIELPPREDWPPAIRPPIKGKIKVISDQDATGIKIHVEKKNRSQPMETGNEGAVAAIGLFENLVPLLNQWFENKLSAILPLTGMEKPKTTEPSRERTPKAPKAPGTDGSKKSKAQSTPGPSGIQSDDPATWSQVVSRRERARRRKQQAEQTPPVQEAAKRTEKRVVTNKAETNAATPALTMARKATGREQGGKSKAVKTPRMRPPRAAAVTLTCPPGQYAEVLGKARKEIKLEELGVPALRPKRALTGALVLEIPGPDGAAKAKLLKDKLQAMVGEMEGVRVARPVKSVELRIKDLLEDTTEDEVRQAIVAAGECDRDDVKVGAIRATTSGLFTAWARCPIAAANKIAGKGRIPIGWTSARVDMLAARPLACFRCLEQGHVQANCRSPVDRRNACYRCGQPGHMARDCMARPCCPICSEAGRPAVHRVGGEACKGRRVRPAVRGDPPPRKEENPVPVRPRREEALESMDVEVEGLGPAVRGDPPPREEEDPIPARSQREESPESMEVDVEGLGPAVRSGSPRSPGRSPVPVRPSKEEGSPTWIDVGRNPPPKEQRKSAIKKKKPGREEPEEKPGPSRPTEEEV